MREKMARLEYPSLMTAMNELSTHDHSRFQTRTKRVIALTLRRNSRQNRWLNSRL